MELAGTAASGRPSWPWRTAPSCAAIPSGAPRDALGEVVFNTGMTGYQEILSDPSYSGQFVTMTYPEIGNTGINADDMESRRFFANGFLVHEMQRAEQLAQRGVAGDGAGRAGHPGHRRHRHPRADRAAARPAAR